MYKSDIELPSSRILWDEDTNYEQLSDDCKRMQIHIKDDIPETINNLIVVETPKLTHIARTCLSKNSKLLAEIQETEICAYKLKDNDVMVFCNNEKDIMAAEVTENLSVLILKAKTVIVITSKSATMYYTNDVSEITSVFIRSLSCYNNDIPLAPKLKSSNLITGISAGVMSYCQCLKKKATIYVCYFDLSPMDSILAQPVLELFRRLNLNTENPFEFTPMVKTTNNIYI